MTNSPERYDKWQTVANRFYRWHKAGLWDRIFAAVQARADVAEQIDWEVYYVNDTTIFLHQHSAGAKKEPRARSSEPKPRWFPDQGALKAVAN